MNDPGSAPLMERILKVRQGFLHRGLEPRYLLAPRDMQQDILRLPHATGAMGWPTLLGMEILWSRPGTEIRILADQPQYTD